MHVYECDRECIDIVEKIFNSSFSWFHSYYAKSCIEVGVCRSVVAYEDEDVAIGVFYSIDKLSVGVIYYVAVLPTHRRRGVGKIIVASIEEILSSEGISTFLATTRSSNIASRRMLNGLGYVALELDRIDEDIREAITMLTCGYEDDILYIKTFDKPIDEFFKKLIQNLDAIELVWRTICYNPWRKLRKKTSLDNTN
ncbi:MAG: GNAT family N-acetyltransferase [Ignisphaera sp.]